MQQEYRELVGEFVALLKERFGADLVSVVLYGSVATGTARPTSDVDVCVVIRNLPASLRERTKLITPLLRALRNRPSYRQLADRGYFPEIMPILYTPDEVRETKPIFLDMVEDSLILVDDGTFAAKLTALRDRLAALGSQRVTLEDGTQYWVLKPDLKPGEVVTL
jgi:predicted nucleotidyltransferase